MGNQPSTLRSRQTVKNGKGNTDMIKVSHSYSKNSFILGLSHRQIHVVSANDNERLTLSAIIRSHCTVVKEGWTRNITYAFKIKKMNKTNMISLLSNLLFTLYQNGWDPLAPVDVGKENKKTLTTICFRKRPKISGSFKSLRSRLSMLGTSTDKESSCFCLELYQHSILVFHSVPNSVLAELVTTANYAQGIAGVSRAVFSVISDYSRMRYPVMASQPGQGEERWVKLAGLEDCQLEDGVAVDNIEISIIACLAKFGYKLSIPINWDMFTRMFFFIMDMDDSKEVRQQSKSMAGVGSKDSLTIYRPIIKRSRSSFFRSFDNRAELKRRITTSLQKKIRTESKKPAWFQQTSTDIGTDYEFDDTEEYFPERQYM